MFFFLWLLFLSHPSRWNDLCLPTALYIDGCCWNLWWILVSVLWLLSVSDLTRSFMYRRCANNKNTWLLCPELLRCKILVCNAICTAVQHVLHCWEWIWHVPMYAEYWRAAVLIRYNILMCNAICTAVKHVLHWEWTWHVPMYAENWHATYEDGNGYGMCRGVPKDDTCFMFRCADARYSGTAALLCFILRFFFSLLSLTQTITIYPCSLYLCRTLPCSCRAWGTSWRRSRTSGWRSTEIRTRRKKLCSGSTEKWGRFGNLFMRIYGYMREIRVQSVFVVSHWKLSVVIYWIPLRSVS